MLGTHPLDNYNQPNNADAAWFSDLASIVNDVLVWGGGGEILIDSIRKFGKKLKVVLPNKSEMVVQDGVGHEEFIFDGLLGYKEKAEGTKLIESWIGQRI